ncbi:MAG: hypothetical protein V1925_05180 [Candidatus Omnitrophota bacterium]
MGAIYKLKAEIKDFIIEQKKTKPALSCRGIVSLVEGQYQIKLSKSSINAIIKESGLSMPVGRRQKHKRRLLELSPKAQEDIKYLTQALTKPEETVPVEEKPIIEPPAVEQEPIIEQAPVEEKPAEIKAPEPPLIEEKPIIEPVPVVEKPAEPKPEEPPPTVIRVEPPAQEECTGAVLLKAVDCLINGSHNIAEALKWRLNRRESELLPYIEGLLYMPLFESSPGAGGGGSKLTPESILSYFNGLQGVREINLDIIKALSAPLQEAHFIKVVLADGKSFYLDGQFRTVWSTPYLPYNFNATISNIKGYINRTFRENLPLLLFMAPGYDSPTQEFFSLLLSMDPRNNGISKLVLCGNKFEELESIPVEQNKTRFFVFGLWPWQFTEYREVKKIGEFKPFNFAPQNKDYYLADAAIVLSQPSTKQQVTLRGCVLKTSLAEKARCVILTNLTAEMAKNEDLAVLYLDHWPNPEESFRDTSRKIELFTYTGNAQRYFSTENLNLGQAGVTDIKALFSQYLKALDLYARWYFFPAGYEKEDFSTTKERFYDLKATITREKELVKIKFSLPSAFPFLKDLEYACRRLNERAVVWSDKRRLWFQI